MESDVLVALDGSASSERAFEFALESHPESRLHFLYVVDMADMEHLSGSRGFTYPDSAEFDRAVEDATAFLDEFVERARNRGIDVDASHVHGEPAREIVAFADRNDVDHVIVGSHGRTGAARILLGSVAELVVRRSPVPVTVVR